MTPRISTRRLASAAALAALLLPLPLHAAAEPSAVDGGTPATPRLAVAPDSPRASLTHFLDLTREGRYGEASRYLELSPEDQARAPEQARKLKAVLDRHLWFDLEALSASPQGRTDDGLPPEEEEIGQLPGPGGAREPLRLVKQGGADRGRWVFSRPTVERIDTWYQQLHGRWLLEHIPAPLLRPGPKELLWWQWLALPLVLVAATLLGFLLARLTQALLRVLVSRTRSEWDDAMLRRMGGPLTLAWALTAFAFLVPLLALVRPAEELLERWVRAGYFVVFFWGLGRSVDVVRQVLAHSPWARTHPASRSLLPLGARVLKVAVLAVAVVAMLSELGYPVASLVAGLGIGGLALALAAQKTVENLFGAFSIGADQPFREGDFVRIEDFVGTVETIGLRSTRIRTLDRTLISLPNGKLADMRVESFAPRDRIRLFCTLGLVYSTRADQLRQVLQGLEARLRAHPKLWPDSLTVRFFQFGASSLDIEVMAWFQTQDFDEFKAIREGLFLEFMEVVEQAGSSFAFPTRTVHLVGGPASTSAERE